METVISELPLNIYDRSPRRRGPPLVYINGLVGEEKEETCYYIAKLLGPANSFVVDVGAIGRDDDGESIIRGEAELVESTRRLLTHKDPSYFSYYSEEEAALEAAEGKSVYPLPRPTPPCSEKRLARSLMQGGCGRIAIIAFCAFDTPTSDLAMKTFRTAAELAGRAFIPVVQAARRKKDATLPYSACRVTPHTSNSEGGDNISSSSDRKKEPIRGYMLRVEATRTGPLFTALRIQGFVERKMGLPQR
ncbi:hypothetical protein V8F20_000607 [Naviculisporaceae sp. PSN 640]